MTKEVVVILPHGVIELVVVPDGDANVSVNIFDENNKHGVLTVPIETRTINGKEKHYGAYSGEVSEEDIQKALI